MLNSTRPVAATPSNQSHSVPRGLTSRRPVSRRLASRWPVSRRLASRDAASRMRHARAYRNASAVKAGARSSTAETATLPPTKIIAVAPAATPGAGSLLDTVPCWMGARRERRRAGRRERRRAGRRERQRGGRQEPQRAKGRAEGNRERRGRVAVARGHATNLMVYLTGPTSHLYTGPMSAEFVGGHAEQTRVGMMRRLRLLRRE